MEWNKICVGESENKKQINNNVVVVVVADDNCQKWVNDKFKCKTKT